MKRVVFVSLAAFLAVSLSAQTTDTKKDSEVELNQYGQQVNSIPGQVKIQDGIMVLDAKKIDYKMWFDIRVQGDAAVFFGGPDFTSSQLDGKDNPNHIGNGMSIRRARFAVKAQLDRNWYGEMMEYVNSRMPFWPIMECQGLRSRQVISRSLSPSSATPHPVTLCSWNARW